MTKTNKERLAAVIEALDTQIPTMTPDQLREYAHILSSPTVLDMLAPTREEPSACVHKQVVLDLHDALQVNFGDDVYARIEELKTHSHEFAEYVAEIKDLQSMLREARDAVTTLERSKADLAWCNNAMARERDDAIARRNEVRDKNTQLEMRVQTQRDTITAYIKDLDTLRTNIAHLRNVHKVQASDGNWNVDAYQLGMFNGLELAMAIMDSRDVQYRTLPQEVRDNEVSEAYATGYEAHKADRAREEAEERASRTANETKLNKATEIIRTMSRFRVTQETPEGLVASDVLVPRCISASNGRLAIVGRRINSVQEEWFVISELFDIAVAHD